MIANPEPKFRNYNLIDIVRYLQFNIEPGTEREYLETLPEGVKREVLRNLTAIANAGLPRIQTPTCIDIDPHPSDSPYNSPY